MALIASFSRFSDYGTLVNNYRLTTSTSAVNEGGSVTFTFNTFGVPNGTTFYYSIVGTNITSSDFTDGLLTGSFTVTSDVGTITKTLSLDGSSEIGESFILNVHLGSTSGEIAMTSSTVYITDGTVVVYGASSSVNENATLGFTVSTTNTPVSTLYWQIVNITTTNTDFSETSGTVSISGGTGSFDITTNADLTTEGSETFRVDIKSISSSGPVVASSSTVTITDTSITPVNQVAYTTAGTYSWTAPAGVSSVSVLCIGGGGGGDTDVFSVPVGSNYSGSCGGGGGGLGYKNNITVVPGNSYTVVVGAGGVTALSATSGGNSYFISSGTVQGNGGTRGTTGGTGEGAGGGYVGDGGGNGGKGGGGRSFSYPAVGGGGGAGGYSGAGGNGGDATDQSSATAGNGGGGGGGAMAYYSTVPMAGGYGYGGNGGGTGLLGLGSNGTAGVYTGGASTGGSGTAGSSGTNQLYGGGGGATRNGGVGAVRIMWPGNERSYPSTRTANE